MNGYVVGAWMLGIAFGGATGINCAMPLHLTAGMAATGFLFIAIAWRTQRIAKKRSNEPPF